MLEPTGLTIPFGVQVLIVFAAALGACYTIWRKGVKPAHRFLVALGKMPAMLAFVEAQMLRNGGSSLRDVVDKTATEVLTMKRDLYVTAQIERATLALLPDAVYEMSASGACRFVSPAWCELTGLSSDDALGNGWLSAVHELDRDEVRGEWLSSVHEGRSFDLAFRFKTPDDLVIPVHARAMPIRDADGAIAAFLGTARRGPTQH